MRWSRQVSAPAAASGDHNAAEAGVGGRVGPRWVEYATFALLTLIWGTTWAVIRVGLRSVPPFTGVSLRFAIGAALLFGMAKGMGVPLLHRPTRQVWQVWILNTLLTFCIPYGVLYWSEQWVPSGLAAVLFATSPLWVALAAHAALPNERLRVTMAVGVLVGFAGVAVVFSDDLRSLGGVSDGSRVVGAAAVLLMSPLVSAFGVVGVKRYGVGMHPLAITSVPMAFTGLVMGGLALATERGKSLHFDAPAIGSLLYLGLFGSAIGFGLYFWLLSRLNATTMSLINYITPLVALLVGSVVLGESFSARTLAGSALVVGGVATATGLRRGPPPRRPPL
jgi:drug/metabolite transporter (DMT)-like permease